MRHVKKTVTVLAIIIVLAGMAVIEQLATASQATSIPTEEAPKVGYLAPSFELDTLEGGSLGIGQGPRDSAVIVNFWASWCDPCRLEAPFLADMYVKYGDQLDIYGVNGTAYDDLASVKAFVKQYQYTFPTLLDEKGEIFKLYQVPGYPTSFFIDRNGVIRDIMIGLPDNGHEEFEKRLKKLLK
jgi:thiol-disulfide isomerase/thioredoxin